MVQPRPCRAPVDEANVLLRADRRARARYDVARVALVDPPGRGAVALAVGPGLVRRAEPGPAGPLLLEAASGRDGLNLRVWGPPATPAEAADEALRAAADWAGADDDPAGLCEVVAPFVR